MPDELGAEADPRSIEDMLGGMPMLDGGMAVMPPDMMGRPRLQPSPSPMMPQLPPVTPESIDALIENMLRQGIPMVDRQQDPMYSEHENAPSVGRGLPEPGRMQRLADSVVGPDIGSDEDFMLMMERAKRTEEDI